MIRQICYSDTTEGTYVEFSFSPESGDRLQRESISLGCGLGRREDRKNVLSHFGVGFGSGSHSHYRKVLFPNKILISCILCFLNSFSKGFF